MNNFFSKIAGNNALKELLSSHILNRTLSHAYIIEGPANSGKRTLSREISKALCCENPRSSLPCGNCRSCKRIEDGYNTDVFVLTRGERSSISVEDIRAMTSTLGYYPDDGDVKIYIIEEAEKMTPQAQNALLLSLEEPPPYVVFLLLTEDSTSLLETVRSRAQSLKTEIFEASFVADWLRSHPLCKKTDEDTILSCAAMSRGALGNALELVRAKGSKDSLIAAEARKFVCLLCRESKSEALIFAANTKYTRVEFEHFFDCAVYTLRDMLAIKSGARDPDADPELAEISHRLKIRKLFNVYNALNSAKDDITQNNASIYAVMTTLAVEAV